MTEIHKRGSYGQNEFAPLTGEELQKALRERIEDGVAHGIAAAAENEARQRRSQALEFMLRSAPNDRSSYDRADVAMSPLPISNTPAFYTEPALVAPAPVEVVTPPVISRDMIVNGQHHHLSANMSNAEREEFIAAERAQGSRVDYALIDRSNDHTSFSGADQQELNRMLQDGPSEQTVPEGRGADMKSRLESSIVGSGGYNKVSRFKITRKKVLASVALLAASAGVTYAVNPNMLTGESVQASIVPGTDAEADSVIANEADTGIKLTARDIAIGDCLDDAGNGKALVQDKVAITADVKWKIKMIDGSEDVVADEGGLFPKLAIPDATVNLANCITPEKRDAAVKVGENNVVEINYDAIEQQIGIVAGATAPTSEAWELEPVAGITDQASVADITSSMQNSKENVEIAVPTAQAQAGAGFAKDAATVEKARAAMQTKLEADINARVAGLFAAQKSPVDKVTVKFVGTPKEFVYKGPAAPEVKKFTVENIKSVYAINAEVKK